LVINKFKENYLLLILVSFAIAPAIALGEGNRNLLLIGIMCFSPLLLVYNSYKLFKYDFVLVLFMLTIVIFPLYFNPDTMRWSTVLYTLMFCITFMVFYRKLYLSNFTANKYLSVLKYLIFAYFVTLIIQQISVFFGLPIFNLSNYNPAEPWKLNSLSSEPSHSARIVALLMFSFIYVKELKLNRNYTLNSDFKEDIYVWIAFLWVMITMVSATAIIFIFIVFIKFIKIKNLLPLSLFIFILVMFGISFGIGGEGSRVLEVIKATLTLQPDNIIEADHSASFRIVPTLVLFSTIEFSSLNDWFGYGIDYVSTILYKYLPGAGDDVTGGGLMALAIEYGLISFMIFVTFTYVITTNSRNRFLTSVFWFMLIFLNALNTQILWLSIFLLFTNNYFLKNKTHNFSLDKRKNYA